MTRIEDVFNFLNGLDFETVRTAFVMRSNAENDRKQYTRNFLSENGYAEVNCETRFTEYGAPVYEIHGKKYARSEEAHTKAYEEAMSTARSRTEKRDTSTTAVESMASFTCPNCGGAVQKTSVCSQCDLGKSGYKYRYTCESCEFEVASKQSLDRGEQ